MKAADMVAPARPEAGNAGVRTIGARIAAVARDGVRRASTVSLVLYALALGAGIGLATADYATRGGYPFGGVAVGA